LKLGTLELAARIQFVDVTKTSVTCVDPRLDIPSASSPGGDIGEFVHALAAFEHVHRMQLSNQEIAILFHTIVKKRTKKNPFFVCTDESSMFKIQKISKVNNPYHPQNEKEMEKVLSALTNPSHHGDVHISAMLQHPSLWHVRRHLLHEVIRIAYRAILSGDNKIHTVLAVLSGSHSNQLGLVRVQNVMPECTGMVPLLMPRGKASSSPYAIMGYGDLWRPLRAWYANEVVEIMSRQRYGQHYNYAKVSDLIQQLGASRDEQAVLMSKRTHALQLFDLVFDK
tara:strand:- start:144 stop:989 length:846 start_codon:yes stop_codon:yes gene_type:complete